MKRYVLTLIILTISLTAMAQATQPCLVLQYNQKQKKTPLGGVQVTVTNAGSTISGADGRLTLSFRTLKPGAHVNFISAKKAGYEVFNSGAIKSWNISSEGTPFPIVLVRSDYFNQLKENLGKAPAETYEAQYRQALEELKQQKLREEEYNRRYDELEQKYNEQMIQLENYIDLFARIDLSEVSAEEQRILDMVQQGKIDEALEAYDKLGLLDKLETEAQAFQTLNDAAQQKKNNINELYEAVQRQVAVLIQAEKKEEAEQKLLQLLATITPMYEISPDEYRYRMAKTQGLLGEVAIIEEDRLRFLQAALNEFTILYDQSPDMYLQDLSRTEYLLGKNYNYVHETIAEKKKLLLAASDHYTLLFQQDTLKHGKTLIDIQEELGKVYRHQKDLAKAEKYYLIGLDLATLLARLDPIQFYQELYTIQRTLGVIYLEEVKDTVRAEKYMCMSVESRIQMFIHEQGKDWGDFGRSYRIISRLIFHLIDLYVDDLKDLAKAERYILKQIERFTPLTEQDPRKYGEFLLDLNYELDELEEIGYDSKDPQYLAKQEEYALRYIEAWRFLIQLDFDCWGIALASARHRFGIKKLDSQIYTLQSEVCLKLGDNEYMAINQCNWGRFYSHLDDYAKAEDYYLKALENLTQLFTQNPSKYREDLANTYNSLAYVYASTQDYTKAIETIDRALALWPEKASYYASKIEFLLKKGDGQEAEKTWRKAKELVTEITDTTTLESLSRLLSQNPEENRADLVLIQNHLGDMYYKSKEYGRSEGYYLEALENCNMLFSQDPDAYRADLATTQYNLGALYDNLHDYAKAEEYYLKALENYTQLFNQDPSTHLSRLVNTQEKLVKLYKDHQDYSKEEELYLKIVELYTQLFNQDPDTYRADLAIKQLVLGIFYHNRHNYAKAEEYYLKVLENHSQLFVKDPSSNNRAELARTQYLLGALYNNLHDYAKSEEYYLKALENYTLLFNRYPYAIRADLAMTRHYLGNLYYFHLHDYSKAEEYYLKALENRIQLFSEKPNTYREDLADSYNQLAYLYAHQNNFAKALETIDRAIELMPEEANFYDSKGEILLMKGDEQEAVKMWQKVLELDPDFLPKHNSDTELHRQLKEKGLIND